MIALWLAAGMTSIALSGDRVLTTSLDGKVQSWKNGSSRVIASRDYELYAVAANGDRIAFCGNSPEINLDGRTLRLPAGWCLSLAFSPDGRTLAAGTSEKQVELFDVASGKIARSLDTKWSTSDVAWSPDGKTLATASYGVSLWNAADGSLLRKLEARAIRAVAFSHDGTRVAAAGRDAYIWSAASGDLLRTIVPEGFAQFVGEKAVIEPINVPLLAVDLSPDGKTLATAGSDRLVRIWDIETGKELQRFEGHRASITAVRFLPDGIHLVSASLDRTVRFWTVGQ